MYKARALVVLLMLLATGIPCWGVKPAPPPPVPAKPAHSVALTFLNDTGAQLRVELISHPASNSASRQKLPETRSIRPFGQATFVSARTGEVVQLTLFRNGRRLVQQSFGPFRGTRKQRIKWDGSSLTIEGGDRWHAFLYSDSGRTIAGVIMDSRLAL